MVSKPSKPTFGTRTKKIKLEKGHSSTQLKKGRMGPKKGGMPDKGGVVKKTPLVGSLTR